MEEAAELKKPYKKRKKTADDVVADFSSLTGRKRLVPRSRSEAHRQNLLRKWQDPAFRKRMEEMQAKRRADPEKKWSRRGIFDGHNRASSELIWADARAKAKEIVEKMIENDQVNMPECKTDAERAELALKETVAVLMTPANHQAKLGAARILLDFCKEKPASRSKVTVQAAEEWLNSVTSDIEND